MLVKIQAAVLGSHTWVAPEHGQHLASAQALSLQLPIPVLKALLSMLSHPPKPLETQGPLE